MKDEKYLYDILPEKAFRLRLQYPVIPKYIIDNIRFSLFDWQKQALENFLIYTLVKEAEQDVAPTHLLFNMATGTGKTLLMASLILFYYKQGFKNFIFFVNQNNIVGKTEDNITDTTHNKYLFNQVIVIDDKTINIKKVDVFSNQSEDIEIIFTSIQKLHNSVYLVKENSVFLDDLMKRDLVLLADEAHNLNATTKKGKKDPKRNELLTELSDNPSEEEIERSWEHTIINRILKRDGKNKGDENKNVLLEFTATVPVNVDVTRKYLDKIVYKYDLKDFLNAGYTKEINLVTSSFDKKKRVLQALLFNWYRHHIGLAYNIDLKPVILFRSKFADQSKEENSQKDFNFFKDIIQDLAISDFSFLNDVDEVPVINSEEVYKKGQSRIVDIKKFILDNKINYHDIITYWKDAFNERNCIITNSKLKTAKGRNGDEKTTPDQDRILNSLEDKSNHYTAIFTVKRLTEGWDVLNLYDIVRMYHGRDEGKTNVGGRKAGNSTVSEVQLIGRGVRYYPFRYEDKIPNKRKFDNSPNHELKVLEEFYFHSDNDEHYISELKQELKRQELIPKVEKVQLILDFKPEYNPNNKKSPFAKLKLFLNEKKDNPNKRKKTIVEVRKNFNFEIAIESTMILETKLVLDSKEDITRFNTKSSDYKTLSLTLKDFKKHIILKAVNVHAKRDKSIFRFDKLSNELEILTLEDILKDEFIGLFPIKIFVSGKVASLSDIEPFIQVTILTRFFDKVGAEIQSISNPFIGTDFKAVSFTNLITDTNYSYPKPISVVEEAENTLLSKELIGKDWYVLNNFYGTSEEKNLIRFVITTMENFKQKYDNVYLLRNEEVFKIYDFNQGRGFMPDFLLFLKEKKKELYYQVFIEPKGSQFKDALGNFIEGKEGWKEEFLTAISLKYAKKAILKAESKEYKLIGLPLYNASTNRIFKEKVNEHLGLDI